MSNAVGIQIYSAIIVYCMMAIVQIISASLTDITNLRDLFAKPNCNIVDELVPE